MRYILIDSLNLAHRCKYGTRGDIDSKIGMGFHIILNNIRNMWNKHGGDHLVFCFDGASWRRTIYEQYKRNRVLQEAKKSVREREDDELFFGAFDDFQKYLTEQTNSTVLYNEVLEADDLISFWIQMHPEDEHVIVSSDTDYIQLLADNVRIYDGMKKIHITSGGIFDERNRPLEFSVKSNSKLQVGSVDKNFIPEQDWTEWAMFLKYIRGDTSDNIFPAYPGARVKGTKNKIGIRDAFDDRHNMGYEWNNFMLQRWTDENGNEHVVKDKFEENQDLINLFRHPEDIKEIALETIAGALASPTIPNVGIYFMQFCAKWDLSRISNTPTEYATILNKKYEGIYRET
jgi:5'-3' exonuclease